eukprot:EG_transcript_40961
MKSSLRSRRGPFLVGNSRLRRWIAADHCRKPVADSADLNMSSDRLAQGPHQPPNAVRSPSGATAPRRRASGGSPLTRASQVPGPPACPPVEVLDLHRPAGPVLLPSHSPLASSVATLKPLVLPFPSFGMTGLPPPGPAAAGVQYEPTTAKCNSNVFH